MQDWVTSKRKIVHYAVANCVCKNCEHVYEIHEQQALLLQLGIWPHRCPECEELRYFNGYENLNEYMKK